MTSSIMHSCDESDDSLRITSVEVEVEMYIMYIVHKTKSNNIQGNNHFQKKKKKKMVINRVLDYSDVYFSCLFFESFAKITVFLLKLIFFFILI